MVECGQCGHPNAVGSRFCARCGAALEIEIDEDRAAYSTPVAPGTIFDGKYQVLQEIGRGGMGVVYRGHDLSLGRMVAIKVLPEHFNTDDEVIARFKKEARAMAALDHPNIVPVYAIGQQRSFHYFVMKFLEGATVAELLEAQRRDDPDGARFDPRVVQSVIAQACRGLAHAHRRGLVHRDIKPGNLMVSPEQHVTIMDFGIVKETRGSAEEGGSPLTRTGLVFGTPEYMAPEQAQGQMAPGPQADLYSLGVVAYEMLSGHPPFRGDSPFSVVLKHIKEPPQPLHGLLTGISEPFQDAVFRALEKKVARRYSDADAMADALLAVDPVTGARATVPPGMLASTPPPANRPPRVITIENEPSVEIDPFQPSPSPSDLPSPLNPPAASEHLGGGLTHRDSLDLLPPRAAEGRPPVFNSPPPRVVREGTPAISAAPPLPASSVAPRAARPAPPRQHVPIFSAEGRRPTTLTGEPAPPESPDIAVLEDRPGHYRHLVTARERGQSASRQRRRRRLLMIGVGLIAVGITALLLLLR